MFITNKVLSIGLKCSYQITEFSDGKEALDALLAPDAKLPDLILLDLHMPVFNGHMFLEALKQYGLEGRFLVAICSAVERFDYKSTTLLLPSVFAFYKKPLTILQASYIEDDIREARATMLKGVK